jgi:hypothetical protein
VIVSGDDLAVPVLGYSEKGAYVPENLPSNFAYWMDYLQQQIVWAIENQIPPSEEMKMRWKACLEGNGASLRAATEVSPLLENIEWDQWPPYNNLCPIDPSTGLRSVTGCVATAMAQIMRYHQWPEKGTGTIPAYTTSSGIEIPEVNIDNYDYNWDNMLPQYSYSSNPPASEEAVANLMYHCGTSVKMDYKSSGSGSLLSGIELITYFSYDKSIQNKRRSRYTDDEWHAILKSQIDSRLPVYYSGYPESGAGHAFVCDGYREDEQGLMFHFNWGWSGSANGYYVTTALTPFTYNFNYDQTIFTNIKKDEGGRPVYTIKLDEDLSLSEGQTSVKRNEVFNVVLFISIDNEAVYPFTGEGGLAIVGENDEVLKVLEKFDMNGPYHFSYLRCFFSSEIEPGNYRLKAVAREAGEEEWMIVSGAEEFVDFIDIEVTEGIASDVTLFLYNGSYPSFALTPSPIHHGLPLSVMVGLYNQGDSPFYGDLELDLYDSNGALVEQIGKLQNYYVPNSGYYYTYTFNSSEIKALPGNYTLTLYQKGAINGERKKVNNYYLHQNDMPVTVQRNTWYGFADADWATPANWSSGQAPGESASVTISGTALNFPILTEPTAIGEIHFEPGAQIGGQHYLGGKAFVQYDLNRRNRWLMLSVPLQQVYPGDFTFGGHPLSWVRAFQATESDGITKGSWVTLRGSTTAFNAGDGFVLWLDPDDDHLTRGLKQLYGIRELPFFHHHHPASLTRQLHEAVHHAHDYNHAQSLSTFYNVEHNGTEYVRMENVNYSVPREEPAYQLAGETVSKVLDFGENAEAGGKVTLVGNPFMAALDFDQLYAANSGSIKNSYQVWTGTGYQGYTEDGSFGVVGNNPLTNQIAPLQSFLVEKPENATSDVLDFNASMTDVNPAELRASAVETNKLNITARNATASVLTYIAKREGGRSDYGPMDVRKIINGFGNVPEVYTMKPKGEEFIAVGANIIDSDNLLIPIGLATSYSGEMTLSFTGMDHYDANLHLIDAAENREIELTGLSAREYTFTYTPPKKNGATAACQNRFFVRISKTPTGLAEVSATDPVNVYSSEGLIRVVSGPANRIREVLIYDLQGSLQHATGKLDAIACSIEKKLLTGVYLVKVVAEKNIRNVKLVIQ